MPRYTYKCLGCGHTVTRNRPEFVSAEHDTYEEECPVAIMIKQPDVIEPCEGTMVRLREVELTSRTPSRWG